MARQSVVPKKKRGPAPTGKGAPIQVRLQPDLLTAVDLLIQHEEWAATRPDILRQALTHYLTYRGYLKPKA